MTEPLVLLPGHMCDARLYRHQIECFSPDTTLHIGCITGDSTIRGMAQTVLQNTPEQFALAGLSLGGIVAMEMLRLEPRRVTRIALLDTNHLPEIKITAALRRDRVRRVRNGRLVSVMRDEMKPAYLADGPGKAATLDVVMEMALRLGPEVFERQSDAIAGRPDQTETLASINAPCLMLCGREDRLCSVELHKTMASLVFHARLEVIEGAGHLPVLEQPEATNKALRRWLEEQ